MKDRMKPFALRWNRRGAERRSTWRRQASQLPISDERQTQMQTQLGKRESVTLQILVCCCDFFHARLIMPRGVAPDET